MLNKTVEPLKKYYIVLMDGGLTYPREERSRLTVFNVTAEEAYKIRDRHQYLLKWPMRYAVRSVK